MKNVFQNWKSFFASLKDYKRNPHKYTRKPSIPKYIRSSEKEILYTNQDCVIPKYNEYVVELVLDVPSKQQIVEENGRYMSIDLGIDNLATIVTQENE